MLNYDRGCLLERVRYVHVSMYASIYVYRHWYTYGHAYTYVHTSPGRCWCVHAFTCTHALETCIQKATIHAWTFVAVRMHMHIHEYTCLFPSIVAHGFLYMPHMHAWACTLCHSRHACVTDHVFHFPRIYNSGMFLFLCMDASSRNTVPTTAKQLQRMKHTRIQNVPRQQATLREELSSTCLYVPYDQSRQDSMYVLKWLEELQTIFVWWCPHMYASPPKKIHGWSPSCSRWTDYPPHLLSSHAEANQFCL